VPDLERHGGAAVIRAVRGDARAHYDPVSTVRPANVDAWFERFRASGEPRWLGAVFDATAPELLRVASHLCRERHDAEDAVQSCFLAAIEARGEWDAERPLLPWLLGLLVNRVREQRRRAARTVDAARVMAGTATAAARDPADVATGIELTAACIAAIDALDEPFRSTLRAHLVHGLAAHEIAARDGVAAGTVRMRLCRGLERLRAALPAGVAGGAVAAVALAPAALANVRAAVLAHAAAAPGATAASTTALAAGAAPLTTATSTLTLGALLMKSTVAAAVILLAVITAWLAWPAASVEVPRAPLPARTTDASVPGGEHAPTFPAPEAAVAPSQAREAAPASEPPAALANARPRRLATTVRGRVVTASGEGAPRAMVQVAPRVARCDDDGSFVIDVVAPDLALLAWAPGHHPAVVAAIGRHPDAIAGTAVSVVLPGAALAIGGVVRTADGAPATGWQLHLYSGGMPVEGSGTPPLTLEDLAHGATTSFGEFVVGFPRDRSPRGGTARSNPNEVAVGDEGAFRIGGLRDGHDYVLRAWHPTTLQTALSTPIRAGTRGYVLALPPADCRPRVTGQVVDRHGGGVAGVRVRAVMRFWSNGGNETYATGPSATTNAAGAFELASVARQPLLLRFDGDAIEPTTRELPAAAGDGAVVVVAATICRFRFEPDAALPPPTSIQVLDSAGHPLRVERLLEPGHSEGGTWQGWKRGDEQRELRVPDRAFELVVRCSRSERRVRLQLRHGEVTPVRG
jgi:RNA polymerase sigma factor (sigma-70 family)